MQKTCYRKLSCCEGNPRSFLNINCAKSFDHSAASKQRCNNSVDFDSQWSALGTTTRNTANVKDCVTETDDYTGVSRRPASKRVGGRGPSRNCNAYANAIADNGNRCPRTRPADYLLQENPAQPVGPECGKP